MEYCWAASKAECLAELLVAYLVEYLAVLTAGCSVVRTADMTAGMMADCSAVR